MNLTEFNSVTTDFDLLVGAAHVAQLSVLTPLHQISGAVHARARSPEWACDKTGCRQVRATQVSARLPGAGHIQLSNDTHRHLPEPTVEHEEGKMLQWHADRTAVATDISVVDFPE